MPLGSFRINSLSRYAPPSASRTAKTITAVGNAQIDTAQSKFGGASGLFDGNGDYLSFSNENLNLATNEDFCIECWYRLPTLSSQLVAFFNGGALMPYLSASGSNWLLAVWNGSFNYVVSSAFTLTANTWYHMAFTRSGSTMTLWHNGTNVGSAGSLGGAITMNATSYIGLYSTSYYNGWIDEFRYSRGTPRYTANFTPSTTAFVNDANTYMLLHMDGTDASTTFTDDNS